MASCFIYHCREENRQDADVCFICHRRRHFGSPIKHALVGRRVDVSHIINYTGNKAGKNAHKQV